MLIVQQVPFLDKSSMYTVCIYEFFFSTSFFLGGNSHENWKTPYLGHIQIQQSDLNQKYKPQKDSSFLHCKTPVCWLRWTEPTWFLPPCGSYLGLRCNLGSGAGRIGGWVQQWELLGCWEKFGFGQVFNEATVSCFFLQCFFCVLLWCFFWWHLKKLSCLIDRNFLQIHQELMLQIGFLSLSCWFQTDPPWS